MLLVTLAEVRDIVVIVYGVMGVILMLALAIAAFGLWFAVRALTRAVMDLLDDPVKPALEDMRRTVANVRGSTEFMADNAVSPLIRVIALGRGLRRGVSTVAGVRGRLGK